MSEEYLKRLAKEAKEAGIKPGETFSVAGSDHDSELMRKAYQFIQECDSPLWWCHDWPTCFFCEGEPTRYDESLVHKSDCIWKIIHDPA